MNAQDTAKVPPNGKWGWMIVVAYALNGISTLSIMQGFGLIFKDTFPLLGFTATQGAVIINANLASGIVIGLVNGPLIRALGYRKMAVIGSLFYSSGVIMTAFAKTFTSMMIFYGVLASLGTSMTLSAFSYALNSYFTTKRGRAMSLAMTIIGLGPIIIPQVTIFLISYYGLQGAMLLYGAFSLHSLIGGTLLHPLNVFTRDSIAYYRQHSQTIPTVFIIKIGTILLYGAFSLHSLIGGTLLHPLKWHAKDANKSKGVTEVSGINGKENGTIDEKISNFPNDEDFKASMSNLSIPERRRKTTITNIDHDSEIGSIYGIDIPYARQISETLSASFGEKEIDMYTLIENGQEKGQSRSQFRKRRFKSIDTINLGSSFKIFDEKSMKQYGRTEENVLLPKGEEKVILNGQTVENEECERNSSKIRLLKIVGNLFDLELLRDPIYVNIMIGMSAAIFAEINFSQLTPFILTEMKLSSTQIANVMSVIATVDLIFRSMAPFIGERLRQPPRIMYLLSLCLLIISRTSLLFVNGFISMIIVAVGLGVAKGIRSVYMPLVIPSYVPIHRLPNASGIQMIVNGSVFLSAGPILGIIRDNIGSYTPCIIVMNGVTALTVIMWSVEILILRRKKLQTRTEQ